MHNLYQKSAKFYTIDNEKSFPDGYFSYIVHILIWRTQTCAMLKFKRLTIGQNCSAVCANKGGHE